VNIPGGPVVVRPGLDPGTLGIIERAIGVVHAVRSIYIRPAQVWCRFQQMILTAHRSVGFSSKVRSEVCRLNNLKSIQPCSRSMDYPVAGQSEIKC
jgi:hypothetical protein